MIGQFVDTVILESTDKRVVVMTHQTVRLGKYWKLFPTTSSNLSDYFRQHHESVCNHDNKNAYFFCPACNRQEP